MTRKTRRTLIGCAVLLGVVAAFLVEEKVRGHLELKAWKRAMEAQGEHFNVAELAPPTTNANARVVTPQQLQTLLVVDSGSDEPAVAGRLPPGKQAVLWKLAIWLGANDSTNDWKSFTDRFAGTRERLPAFSAELTNRDWVVQLDYASGFNQLLPYLAPLKNSVRTLRRGMLIALHEHGQDEAVEDLLALRGLTDIQRNEPLIISQLVRVALAEISLGAVWQALQADGWSDAQLATLQDAWAAPHFLLDMSRAIEMERAMAGDYFTGPHASSSELRQLLSGPTGLGSPLGGEQQPATGPVIEWLRPILDKGSEFRWAVFLEIWRFAWAEQDQLFHHRVLQERIRTAREADRLHNASVFQPDEAGAPDDSTDLPRLTDLERMGRFARARHWLSLMMLSAVDLYSRRAAVVDCHCEMAVTAIALKRYQLKHGQWPAKLSALVPEFLASEPRDWMDGQPLRYRLNPDGTFLLYSVGADGKDDDGDPRPKEGESRSMLKGRDFVWPQPATEAEIEAANASPNPSRRR